MAAISLTLVSGSLVCRVCGLKRVWLVGLPVPLIPSLVPQPPSPFEEHLAKPAWCSMHASPASTAASWPHGPRAAPNRPPVHPSLTDVRDEVTGNDGP